MLACVALVTAGSSMVRVASTSAATPDGATPPATAAHPGSAAERVSRLEADQEHRALTSGYLTRAKLGLDRATKLRAQGDSANAAIAERGALTWVDAAETLARSVDRETEAASLELGALDAGARAERERALLEEALGNAGRRRAELARIERERSSVAPRTRTADIDGGVSPPAATSGTPGTFVGRDAGALELHMPGTKKPLRPTEESPP